MQLARKISLHYFYGVVELLCSSSSQGIDCPETIS
jgi:hypothetical protein